jgi:hypothetical protein
MFQGILKPNTLLVEWCDQGSPQHDYFRNSIEIHLFVEEHCAAPSLKDSERQLYRLFAQHIVSNQYVTPVDILLN